MEALISTADYEKRRSLASESGHGEGELEPGSPFFVGQGDLAGVRLDDGPDGGDSQAGVVGAIAAHRPAGRAGWILQEGSGEAGAPVGRGGPRDRFPLLVAVGFL